jgi:hypothetical protein
MNQSNFSRREVIGGAVTVGLATGTVSNDIVRAAPTTADEAVLMDYFLTFSEAVTGFSRSDLESTGQGANYYATARNVLGASTFAEFLQTFHGSGLNALLSSSKQGPIARNLTKLWYSATWTRLPREWQDTYGTVQNDTTFIVSSAAYTRGLLWRAIGVNPPGAGPPGYGSWGEPPNIT